MDETLVRLNGHKMSVIKPTHSSKTKRHRPFKPRYSEQYDSATHGWDLSKPKQVARFLIGGAHIGDVVKRLDRLEFPPNGFPDAEWFDKVLTFLVSYPPSNASIRKGDAFRRLQAIARVAQLLLTKECPVLLRGVGEPVEIWGERTTRLYDN